MQFICRIFSWRAEVDAHLMRCSLPVWESSYFYWVDSSIALNQFIGFQITKTKGRTVITVSRLKKRTCQKRFFLWEKVMTSRERAQDVRELSETDGLILWFSDSLIRCSQWADRKLVKRPFSLKISFLVFLISSWARRNIGTHERRGFARERSAAKGKN